MAKHVRLRESDKYSKGRLFSHSRNSPIILFDIMDTVVTDPFYKFVPKFFGLTFDELLKAKHPDMWIRFEKGEISELTMLENFFLDKRCFDHSAFVSMMCDNYEFVVGMENILARLRSLGMEIHAFSNYPEWYKNIEEKLDLDRYLDWTFVSCVGPLKGYRKPEEKAFEIVLETLKCKPEDALLIDDRAKNIEAATKIGLDGIQFKDSISLGKELERRGILD